MSIHGNKVANYLDAQEDGKEWKNFGEISFGLEHEQQILALIIEFNKIYILRFLKDDVLVWAGSKPGI